uniref:Serpentine receptor class gamma n=1 Tax=Caenorhabditis tropicalis TaxID=1561998 RepID=A0A1I7U7Z5_9PELO
MFGLWYELIFGKLITMLYNLKLLKPNYEIKQFFVMWTENQEKMLVTESFDGLELLLFGGFLQWHYIFSMIFGILAVCVERIIASMLINKYESNTQMWIPITLTVFTQIFTIAVSCGVTFNKIGIFTVNAPWIITSIISVIDIHSYRYCFFVFISDGWFVDSSPFGINLLSARCSLISGSYAVLLSHFIYRYLAIRNSFVVTQFHVLMTGAFLLFVAYFVTWDVVRISVNSDTKLFFQIAQNFVYSDDEAKNYIQKEFLDLFEANSSDVNEASDAVVFRAWVGVI